MSITVKKVYKPHAKDSKKEVHIGDGEKGVAHSYLGVDLSKHSYSGAPAREARATEHHG